MADLAERNCPPCVFQVTGPYGSRACSGIKIKGGRQKGNSSELVMPPALGRSIRLRVGYMPPTDFLVMPAAAADHAWEPSKITYAAVRDQMHVGSFCRMGQFSDAYARGGKGLGTVRKPSETLLQQFNVFMAVRSGCRYVCVPLRGRQRNLRRRRWLHPTTYVRRSFVQGVESRTLQLTVNANYAEYKRRRGQETLYCCRRRRRLL